MVLTAALIAVGLILAAGPLFRTGFVPLPAAFAFLGVGAIAGAAAFVTAVIAAVLGARRGQSLSPALLAGGVLGLVAVAVPAQRVWAARGLPAIHSISTDLEDPPSFEAVLPLRGADANPVTFSADVAAQQARAYPDIRPLILPTSPAASFSRALDAARNAGWAIVSSDASAGRIEATDTTRWFGFKDDIVVRLMPSGDGTRVDVRSVSRIGRGDLGTNAARIRAFLASLG
jgi:uncharacterized protein (DUF1499 family)